MKFSIIILNYNTFDLTKNCLNSIFDKLKSFDFEIIVIDNASQDRSGEDLKEIFGSRIKFIKNSENLGFAVANNIGARQASGEYLWFLNSDTLVKDVDLDKLDSFFRKHGKLGILGLDLLLENKERQAFAFGEFLSFKNLIKRKSNSGKDVDGYIEADWVSGAAMVVKNELFARIGGFDERYFMYFEDMDICRQVKAKGFSVLLIKGQSVIHFGGKSSLDFAKMKRDYYESQNYYFKKYYGILSQYLVMVLRFFYLLFNKNKK